MDELISLVDLLKDYTSQTGLTLIVFVCLIGFYFSNKKDKKNIEKTTSAIDNSLDALSRSVLTLNQSNKELFLNMTSYNNDLTKSIISGITDQLVLISETKKSQHRETIKTVADCADEIKTVLHNILLTTKSDLVVLTQLHNGEENLNGIPYVKYDITDQTISTHSLPIFGQTYCRPIAEYSLIYKKVIENPDNLFWGNMNEINDDIDNSISARLKKINKKSLICIGLYNSENTLYAFINILYNEKYLTEEFINMLNISKYKYQIEDILRRIKNS